MLQNHILKIWSIVGIAVGLGISIYLEGGLLLNVMFSVLGGGLMSAVAYYFISKGHIFKLVSIFLYILYYVASFFVIFLILSVAADDNYGSLPAIISLIVSIPVSYLFTKREIKKYISSQSEQEIDA